MNKPRQMHKARIGDLITTVVAAVGFPVGALGRVTGAGDESFTADFGELGEFRFRRGGHVERCGPARTAAERSPANTEGMSHG
jgi:hypothetical protein